VWLFLDYDGTLAPFKEHPSMAKMPVSTRRILNSLKRFLPIYIVSGRSLSDIKEMVNIKDIFYIGNHGFQILTPDKNLYIPPKAKKLLPFIEELILTCKSYLGKVEGIFIEEKDFSFSIHYRACKKKEEILVKKIIEDVILKSLKNKELQMLSGKKVFEIRPSIEWNKGVAVLWILERYAPKDCLPIYIGDDTTDEDAFLLIKKGLTILVAEREDQKTNAKYYLKGTEDVQRFLKILLKFCQST
jgi:trehalose-phosphatase